MLPISLRTNPGSWRVKASRNAQPGFAAFKTKVFVRDNYTCRFCGFQAKEYQDVVNLDHDYRNNKMSNLATACCFCSQCFFLEAVGVGDFGGGTLIYLPELTQGELNSFCHVLFCAITNDTGYKTTSQSIYRNFKFRSQIIEDKFGEGTSNPTVLGQLLIESGHYETEVGERLLADIRLLPSRAKFRKQIEHWAANALDELATEF